MRLFPKWTLHFVNLFQSVRWPTSIYCLCRQSAPPAPLSTFNILIPQPSLPWDQLTLGSYMEQLSLLMCFFKCCWSIPVDCAMACLNSVYMLCSLDLVPWVNLSLTVWWMEDGSTFYQDSPDEVMEKEGEVYASINTYRVEKQCHHHYHQKQQPDLSLVMERYQTYHLSELWQTGTNIYMCNLQGYTVQWHFNPSGFIPSLFSQHPEMFCHNYSQWGRD